MAGAAQRPCYVIPECHSPRGMRLGQCGHSLSRSLGSTKNSAASCLSSSASLSTSCLGGRTSPHAAAATAGPGGLGPESSAAGAPGAGWPLAPLALQSAVAEGAGSELPTALLLTRSAGCSTAAELALSVAGGPPSAASAAPAAASFSAGLALLPLPLTLPSRPPYCQSLAMGWPACCRCTRIWCVRPVFGLHSNSIHTE